MLVPLEIGMTKFKKPIKNVLSDIPYKSRTVDFQNSHYLELFECPFTWKFEKCPFTCCSCEEQNYMTVSNEKAKL